MSSEIINKEKINDLKTLGNSNENINKPQFEWIWAVPHFREERGYIYHISVGICSAYLCKIIYIYKKLLIILIKFKNIIYIIFNS